MDLDRPVGLGQRRAVVPVDRPCHEHRAAARVERRLDALREPAPGRRVDRDAVDHDLDPALPLAVERGLLVEPDGRAVDPHAHVSRRLELREEGLGRLAHAQFDRREEEHAGAGRMREQPLDRLIDALCAYRRAAIRTVHHAQPRGEHAEVVVHLRERADRAPRRAPRASLLDRDGGCEALDPLEERLRHLSHELPRVGRQALDVPPLPFGVERVERKRRLARPARAAADGHRAARDVGVDLLEVVERRAADRDAGRAGIAGRLGGGREEGREVLRRIGCRPPPHRGFFSGITARREHRPERPARVRRLDFCHLLGRAGRHDQPAAGAPLGPEVDHPVGPLHHVEVVLHDEHGVARVHEPLEHREQLPHVGHVEARRRLVEHVERLAGGPLRQLARELHPLRLAARERGRRLPEVEVVEADVAERLELPGDVGGVGEELAGLADLHGEEFGDVLPLPAHLERVLREPRAAAHLARHPDVRQEIHVEAGRAVPLAGLAAAARDVEAEAARLPAALLRVGQHCEEGADVVPHLHVGGGVAPGRAADR